MNSDIGNLYKRHTSRSSSMSQFTPLAQPSFIDEDDTELLFQLPKKQKTEEAAMAVKPFPKYENHLELIQSKAESAKLQSKVNGLERDLLELKTNFDLEREHLIHEKEKLEKRVTTLERELSFISDKEREAKIAFETLTKNSETEKSSLHENVRQLNLKNRQLESELIEKSQETDARVQTLWLELNRERESAVEYRNSFEQMERETMLQKARNESLTTELKSYIERLAQMTKKCDEQSIMIKQWREENQIATALRLDTFKLKELEKENAVLQQKIQRYKNLSENTTLLREQKSSLEATVTKYERNIKELADENSELKIAIAKSQSNVQSKVTFQGIDYMTKHCMELKSEIKEKESRISFLEKDVLDRELAINKLSEELQQRDEYIETLKRNELRSTSKSDSGVQTEDSKLPYSLSNGENFEIERLAQLVKEKDEHIEHLMKRFGVTPDFDSSQVKILHFSMNPLADAHSVYVNELENLRQQNSSLKLRVEQLEKLRPGTSSSESAMVVDDDVTGIVNRKLHEQKSEQIIEELRAEIVKLTEQRSRIAKINQEVGTQFREMCTLLTGYQVKMKEAGLWMVQSVFEKPERHFMFSKRQDGEVQLLENDYASEWKDFVDTYLITDNSIPAFLSATTLQLFSKMQDSSKSNAVGTS